MGVGGVTKETSTCPEGPLLINKVRILFPDDVDITSFWKFLTVEKALGPRSPTHDEMGGGGRREGALVIFTR